MQKTSKFTTQKLVMTALLVAAYVVINRFFSISTWDIKIGFSFVPVVIGAILLGPIYGGLIGGLGDFIGALLFPFGPYFPGYTATAFLMGWWYGKILQKEQGKKQILLAVISAELTCSLILNTLWISVVYGSSYIALFSTRIMQFALMSLVKIVTIAIMSRYLSHFKNIIRTSQV